MAAPLMVPVGFKFYKALIAEVAGRYGLDVATVAAMCWQESGFNTDAFRHEPDFWNRYLKRNPKYRSLNPRRVSSSYGLMQVMYCRILEDKLATNDAWEPELLFIPENGVDIGCAFYLELVQWAQTKTADPAMVRLAALASYNGGRGGNNPATDNPLRNGTYAREVLAKRVVMEREYGPSSVSIPA